MCNEPGGDFSMALFQCLFVLMSLLVLISLHEDQC